MAKEKMPYYLIAIIGVGGTGGNFAKEFCRYFASLKKDVKEHIRIAFVDGDMVEEKNCSRQPFTEEDVHMNKAAILAEAVGDALGVDVSAYPHYIDSAEELKDLFTALASKANTYLSNSNVVPVLCGCVDNHRARQVMDEFYSSRSTCIYYDAANEFAQGEVVFGVRIKGNEISPPRKFYFPEVMTDKGKSKSEEGCGVVNISSPQHLATNLMSANILLSACVQLISDHKVSDGIVHFDAFRYYVRAESFLKHQKKGQTL